MSMFQKVHMYKKRNTGKNDIAFGAEKFQLFDKEVGAESSSAAVYTKAEAKVMGVTCYII